MKAIKVPVSSTECPRISLQNSQWDVLASIASQLPDVNWCRNALTTSQEEFCSDLSAHGPEQIRDMLVSFRDKMILSGVCVVSTGYHTETDLEIQKSCIAILMSAVCKPFGPYLARGFWQTLGVNPQAEKLRANSIGYIPFHFDLDQASHPPEYVGLYCVRADPFGGGENLIVDYRRLFERLDQDQLSVLKNVAFSFSTLFDTYGIGAILNPHPLIDVDFKGSGEWVCRYNGKARPQFVEGSAEADLFDALEKTFTASSTKVLLSEGDLIVMDQRRILHGREALGERSSEVTLRPDKDRFLLQLYGNSYGLD